MQSRRAILVDGSRLVRDFIRRVIEKEAGFEIVWEFNDLKDLSAVNQNMHIDWIFVVLAPGQIMPDDLKVGLLLKIPSVRIVGVCVGDGYIQAEWMTRHEKDLTGLKLEEFIQFLEQEMNGTKFLF